MKEARVKQRSGKFKCKVYVAHKGLMRLTNWHNLTFTCTNLRNSFSHPGKNTDPSRIRSSKATSVLVAKSFLTTGFIGVLSLGVVGGAGAGFLKVGITVNLKKR